MIRPRAMLLLGAGALIVPVLSGGGAAAAANGNATANAMSKIQHIVVIYEENHSFDNLYGGWEGVNGRSNADAAHTTQISQSGSAYACLLQNDKNLTSPPQPADICSTPGDAFNSHYPNAPFQIDSDTNIPASARTCPQPGAFSATGFTPSPSNLPGGCTRDIVHRFYQEQYQLDGGRQDRYTTGSDAAGLTQGYYDTRALPIYAYLHQDGHPHYAIADDFFQAAFGGSFLNHQWLIAAATPVDSTHPALHSVLDANGMPVLRYPPSSQSGSVVLYKSPSTTPLNDGALTSNCPAPLGMACGDYAVNTIQPTYQPHAFGTPQAAQLPPQPATSKTIGDEMSSAGISWAWYSGGWSNADGDVGGLGWTNGFDATKGCADPNSFANPAYPYCPNKVFQFHHQPFNYYANYAPGTPGRTHLQDEQAFTQLVQSSTKSCNLNSVSFVKPIGLETEHPGYTSETAGSSHLVSLLQSIEASRCAKDTMVVVTYDEFGGQWDHVSPPGQGSAAGATADTWGPGTRIPTLILAPGLHGAFVIDHAPHDTTSILTTIENRFGLARLGTRDAAVQDLSSVYRAKNVGG